MSINYLKISVYLVIFSSLTISCQTPVAKDITATCFYEMNSCGDCSPQYIVKEVNTGDKMLDNKLLNSVIKIVDKKNNTDIINGIYECLICYKFIVTGDLIKTKESYILRAKKVTKIKRKNCCDK